MGGTYHINRIFWHAINKDIIPMSLPSMEQQYLNLMRHILEHGNRRTDRTGTGTRSVFSHEMRCDLSKGFPLLTTKKCPIKCIAHELFWFLKGDTNIKYLKQHNVNIWNEWADKDGNLGPVYGKQWRAWETGNGQQVDQISQLIQHIKTQPNSRRLIVHAWNVGQLKNMALPPCHLMFQCYVHDGKLSLKLTQRSADIFLGVPFNIASYALLTHMLAQQCNLEVGEFIWSGGDCHLYENHLEQARTQLQRKPYAMPYLQLGKTPGKIPTDITDYTLDDIIIHNYKHHEKIPAPISV